MMRKAQTMKIITKQQFLDQYNMTPAFYRKHKDAMGFRGKPGRADQELVEAFLHRYFREGMEKQLAAAAEVEQITHSLNNVILINGKYQPHSREMKGRGGRASLPGGTS